MTIRHTLTSSHPDFVHFSTWIEQKIIEAQNNGNFVEADKIRAAISAKEQSTASIITVNIETGNPNQTIADHSEDHPIVPEFNVYFDQWREEFNVQVLIEDMNNPGIQPETLETAPPPTE